jgi:hypothetical protein
MTTRQRIAWFGSAGALIVAGTASAAVVGGGTGQVLALALIGIGLVLATSLVFLEVGLSEDHERARARRFARSARAGTSRPPKREPGSAGLGRFRSHRRRIR